MQATYGPMSDAILRLFRSRPEYVFTPKEIADAIYASDPEGGPWHSLQTIRTLVHYMRRRGVQIEQVSGYRLLPRR